ncbi:hypothetical protein Tco_1353147 [Tanacetum coccineum]
MGSLILSYSIKKDDLGSSKLSSKVTLRDSSILIVSLLSVMWNAGATSDESGSWILKESTAQASGSPCDDIDVYVTSDDAESDDMTVSVTLKQSLH